MALRAQPTVGAQVMIRHLASSTPGTVLGIEDEGRRLLVTAETGESIAFVLNRATATFTEEGAQHGARLSFVGDSDYDFPGPQTEV